MDLPWGFLRDQEQIWTYQGYYGFSLNNKSKYGPIMGFLRNQEVVRTYHGLSQRSRGSMDLSWAFSAIKSK